MMYIVIKKQDTEAKIPALDYVVISLEVFPTQKSAKEYVKNLPADDKAKYSFTIEPYTEGGY